MRKKREVSSKDRALEVAAFFRQEKNVEVVILELTKVSYTFDYLIICCVDSVRQAGTLYKQAFKFSRKNEFPVYYYQDDPSGQWFVLDYFDFAVHIFTEEAYRFYNLERLWKQAKKIKLNDVS